MNSFLLLLLLTWAAFPGWAQAGNPANTTTPEKQISFAREKKTHAYYVRQAELWWAQVQRDQHSETNWFNYYRACRNAQGSADWKEDFVKESSALRLGADIVALMKTHIPDTFTYYFVAGSTGGVASEGELLLKAYRLNPDFEGIHATLVTHATTTGNAALRQEVNERWFKRNELSPNLLTYAYNVLASLEPGAILLTEHDNDTFPLWMLQDAKHIRPDVSVLNIDFLLDEHFRTATFQKLRIQPLALGAIHVNEYAHNWEKVVHHFVTAFTTDKPLYLAMSLSPTRYEGLTAKMYPTGLAWRYSQQRVATEALNRTLFEQQFLWDYIQASFTDDISQKFVNDLNANYLLMLHECHTYYQRTKQATNLQKVDTLAAQILAVTEDEQVKAKYAGSFAALPRPSVGKGKRLSGK
jgi:hypothetical protein